MPELPEVETIVNALRHGGRGGKPVTGNIVESAQILWDKTLSEPSPGEFCAQISGRKVEEIFRRGKYVIFRLDAGFLLIHLRMSGDLRVDPSSSTQVGDHDRFILNFVDGSRLVFNDTRKFGRVWLVDDPLKTLGKLGIEPFDPALTPHVLFCNLQSKRKYIKSLLLDQSFIAGLGNIYTDESLYRAGIHPLRISSGLTETEAERLLYAIRDTLDEGIKHNGASIDWVYRGGSFQNSFRVYQQTGKPCPVCGTTIERIVAGQRGTHYCPKCQPKGV